LISSDGIEYKIRGIDENEENAYIFLSEIMKVFSSEDNSPLKHILKIIIISACRGGM